MPVPTVENDNFRRELDKRCSSAVARVAVAAVNHERYVRYPGRAGVFSGIHRSLASTTPESVVTAGSQEP
jgi:hypothetical protein